MSSDTDSGADSESQDDSASDQKTWVDAMEEVFGSAVDRQAEIAQRREVARRVVDVFTGRRQGAQRQCQRLPGRIGALQNRRQWMPSRAFRPALQFVLPPGQLGKTG